RTAIPPVNVLSGNSFSVANRASSTSVAASSARPPAPFISISNAVPPKAVNQMIAIRDGTSKTPVINCRIVRPLEILAINSHIKGAQAICQAQKKIVFLPSQSLSDKGVNVKLIGTTLEI